MDKFRHKLPKEELKKFAKEINKKLVSSDYKNKRVEDPTSVSKKQERKVKQYVKEFLDKAVYKYNAHEKKKAERAAQDDCAPAAGSGANPPLDIAEDGEVTLTDDEDVASTPTSIEKKRKREEDAAGSASATPSDIPTIKRLKEEDADLPSPPPPPPPPPEIDAPVDMDMTEQEDILRENEEARRLADEAEKLRLREQEAALEKENELNMRAFEMEQQNQYTTNGVFDVDANASPNKPADEGAGEVSLDHPDGARKHEVMSH